MHVKSRDRPIYQPRANIWVLPIYRYQPKRPILSASAGVVKTLLYSSRIKTTCTRKHNEPSQDVCFHEQADKMNHEARVGHRSRNKSTRLIKNHSKILKMLQLEKF